MIQWKNEGKSRVCDISEDYKMVLIEKKGYVTKITANQDGTLKVENIPKTNIA